MTPDPTPLHPHARPLSDAGNAERLIDRHGADLRYVPAWGTWLTWSGTHWARDEDGEIVRRCTDTIRAMADEVRRAPDDKTAAKVAAHAMRCEAAARLDAMERLARSHLDVVTGVDQLDDRPWLLACANGTVDLRTGTLRPAARDDLLTRRCPVEHDLDAACLRWETFLAEVLPDPDVRSLVQRAVGYSLTGDVSEHRMLVCHGRGANGKSVMVETLRAVLGDHMQQLPGDSLLVRSGDRVNNDIARLPGVRMATLVEVNEARELDSALVKQLTGGDTMTARHLYRDYFEFRLQAKAWMIVNHKPGVRGDDEGLWRRLLLIPFDVVIPPERRDRGLGERLRGELPGILAWAVRGCLAWQRDGLGSAARVDDATRQYRVESDVVGAFLDERCTLGGPSAWTSAAAAYDAWSRWCGEQGERPRSQRWLTIQLTERGVQRQRQGHAGARGFAGLHVDQGPI